MERSLCVPCARNATGIAHVANRMYGKSIQLRWSRIAGASDRDSDRERMEIISNCRDRKSTRLNSSHIQKSRMPSSA